ncbi:MAG: queuosine precursor transporter [Actinobacteria bacterium]|nr:queuosine precursor transporter [Actinomycetota bacterium]
MPARSPLPVAVALLAAAYVAAQMLADVTSLKITEVAGFSMDAGTLVYPFTFTLRDLVHRVAGKEVARALILAAAVVNLFMAGLFWLVARLPAVAGVGPQTDSFGAVLAPVWRIVAASILAEVVAEFIDTDVYSRWERRFGERHQWGRVLASNGVAIPIDSALFVVVAFAGVMSWGNVGETLAANVAVKYLVTLVSVPWIYLVRPGGGRRRRRPDQPVVSGEIRP